MNPGVVNQAIDILQGKNLTASGDKHFAHVFAAHAEASSSDAGYNFILWLVGRLACQAQFAKMLNPGHLIPGGTVIFGYLRLDDRLGIEFAGNDEVWGLVKAWNPFGAPRLPVTDTCLRQYIFNYRLQIVANKFADGISVASKWSSEETLVKEHCVRNSES